MNQDIIESTFDRRRMLKLMGSAGLAVAGVAAVAKSGQAVPGGSSSSLNRYHQDHPASPVPGPQEDGSALWEVQIGGMDIDTGVEYHGFYPGEITIKAGDSIWFCLRQADVPHGDVHGWWRGPANFIPDPEAAAPATPAALPKLIYNPVLMTGTGGNVVDGSQLVSSVADIFTDGSVPYVYSFPTPGEYEYVCIVHAGVMRAKVVVQEAGSAYPLDQAGVDALSAEQIEVLRADGLAQIEQYNAPTSTPKAEGGNLWDVTVGAGGFTQVRVQRILPGELTIMAGDSVKFFNRSEGEPHTVTLLGEGEETPEDVLQETFADGSPKFVQNMVTFLPQGGNVWSGTGFVNSGFMGIPQLGLPMDFELLFDTPGEYIYYCILHLDNTGGRMAAKLIVNAAE